MGIPFYKSKQVEVYNYNESTEDYNVYGEPIEQYKYVGTFVCDFQPLTPSYTLKEYGKILTDSYKIYMDSSTPINDKTVFRLKGESDTYICIGSPQYHYNIIKHVKVEVQKTRQPINVI